MKNWQIYSYFAHFGSFNPCWTHRSPRNYTAIISRMIMYSHTAVSRVSWFPAHQFKSEGNSNICQENHCLLVWNLKKLLLLVLIFPEGLCLNEKYICIRTPRSNKIVLSSINIHISNKWAQLEEIMSNFIEKLANLLLFCSFSAPLLHFLTKKIEN